MKSKFVIILFIVSIFGAMILDAKDDWIAYPKSYDSVKIAVNAGISSSRIPKLIGEDMVQQIPMIMLDLRYGSYKDFSLLLNLKSVVLTNHLSTGLMWSFEIGDFAFALENSIAFWYGFANFTGFDAGVNGSFYYPSLSLGYSINEILLTLKTDVSIMTSYSRKVGSVIVEESKDRLVSVSTSFIIEQPFINNINVLLGFKFNYTKFYYQSWLAFVTAKNWIFIPEFQVGVNLW